jgi:hypothetical protein
VKHFKFQDNGCPCLDCCRLYFDQRWLHIVNTQGMDAANEFQDDVVRRSRKRYEGR